MSKAIHEENGELGQGLEYRDYFRIKALSFPWQWKVIDGFSTGVKDGIKF